MISSCFSTLSRSFKQRTSICHTVFKNVPNHRINNYYLILHPNIRTIPMISSILNQSFSSEANEDKTRLVVSILGPANAGKSTLFNRFMCKESNKSYRLSSEKSLRRPKRSKGRLGSNNSSKHFSGAIVSSTPGTTRDRRDCIGRIGGTYFTLMDTAGVDGERISFLTSRNNTKDSVTTGMMFQTLEAAKKSDLILLMFDGRVGITDDLADIVNWLRKLGTDVNDSDVSSDEMKRYQRKILLLANKLEGDSWANYYGENTDVMNNLSEVSRMGLGEAIPISAQHGEGLAEIAAIIEDMTVKKEEWIKTRSAQNNQIKSGDESDDEIKPLQLAILGRQNVGKSSIVNALLNENRVISGPMPGLTRDSISVQWKWNGRPVQIVDTAGIRRIAKRDHSDNIEDTAVRDAMRAMKRADVAVLVLDGDSRIIQRQELAIADAVVREGRALVIAANKMDLLVDRQYTKRDFEIGVRKQIEARFPMLRQTPVVPMSALTGESVQNLMPVVFQARDRWSRTISTALLNRWLADATTFQQPPKHNGRQVKIKYVMQTKGRPPTFLLFCNYDKLPVSYMRFLTRRFQDDFQMFGMEVRLSVKKSAQNPYEKKKKSRSGTGIGGSEARKKRQIAQLKAYGRISKGRTRRKRNVG